MSTTVTEAIRSAAEGFAVIPGDFINLKIKNSMPRVQDWDEFNQRLCVEMKKKDCVILESQLDSFWASNNTFEEMGDYIDNHCGF